MHLVMARNVNDGYATGLALLNRIGVREESRAGSVLVAPGPVMTQYDRPLERVLFDPKRDANPFFHLMEALWMLGGRRDARWLDQFVGDFSSRFAEPDGQQHGAYGFRWRRHFDIEGGGERSIRDQLDTAVRLLKANPDDRRVVIAMWDPIADLGADKRDIPCNTHIYLRVRTPAIRHLSSNSGVQVEDFRIIGEPVLDITVCCRSNDAVWGCYGANAVHFSILQEYLASCIGVGVGRYYQLSNNFHAYTKVMDKLFPLPGVIEARENRWYSRVKPFPLVADPERFDQELAWFFQYTTVTPGSPEYEPKNTFLSKVAVPMFQAYAAWRRKEYDTAWVALTQIDVECDWANAAYMFLRRRMDRLEAAANAQR